MLGKSGERAAKKSIKIRANKSIAEKKGLDVVVAEISRSPQRCHEDVPTGPEHHNNAQKKASTALKLFAFKHFRGA